MLKQRLITAIVLLTIFLATLFYATPPVFCVFTEIITLAAAWEWSRLMGLTLARHRIFYVLFIFSIMQAIFFSPIAINVCIAGFYATFFFWVAMIPLIVMYPRAMFWKGSNIVQGIMGMFVLIPTWFAINFIRDVDINGQYLLLFLFTLIWGADISAYFIGRRFGRVALASQVSPGKTRVGVIAGIITALLITTGTLTWFKVPYSFWPYTLSLTLVTVVFSVVGDLFESMLKRSEGLKDSGKLLPGHGGLLDRIDSLTAAIPVFTLGAIYLSRLNPS